VGAIDPSIVFNAYCKHIIICINTGLIPTVSVITMIVFGCFTMAALHAESTKFLHLGGRVLVVWLIVVRIRSSTSGILSSALLCLLITSFFARFDIVYSLVLWGGLAINCGFVVYDTQLIAVLDILL